MTTLDPQATPANRQCRFRLAHAARLLATLAGVAALGFITAVAHSAAPPPPPARAAPGVALPDGGATPSPTATGCPVHAVRSGYITSIHPTQSGYLSMAQAISCAPPGSCYVFGAGTYLHHDYPHVFVNNTGMDQCVQITVSANCGNEPRGVQTAAYLGSYDPANVCANAIGGMGWQRTNTQSFFVSVPNGATYTIVMTERTQGLGCGNYTLTVSYCNAGPTTPTPTPLPASSTPTPVPASATRTPAASPTPLPCYLAAWGFGSTNCTPPGTYSYSFPFHAEWCILPLNGTGMVSFEVALSSGGPWTLYDQQVRAVTFANNFPVVTGMMMEVSIPAQYTWYRMAISVTIAGRTLLNSAPAASICGSASSPTPHPPTVTPSGPTVTPSPAITPGGPTVTPPPTVTPGGPTVTPPPTVCAIQFVDVPPTNPFYAFIRCLACRQIVSGYADGTFGWQNNVTRGQLAKIVAGAANFLDPIPSNQQSFEDVPAANPFWVFIERLFLRGAISGYACGGPGEPCGVDNHPYFRWGANATRGQIAKIDALAAAFSDPIPTMQQTFADIASTNVFWLFVEELASRSIISGYGCGGPGEPCDPQSRPYFRWGANTTRGQLAKIAANTFFPGCQTLAPPR